MKVGVRTARWRNTVCAVACASAAVLTASAASADPITEVSGSTLACFGEGCSSFAASVSHAGSTLGFAGVDPFHAVLSGNDVTTVVLGTFTRGRANVSSDADALPFTLQVLFSLPSGISSGQAGSFTASIFGTTPGGGGPVAVDFDNSWHRFTTPTGAFEFAVLTDPELNKNGSTTLIGSVRNVEETSRNSVPEPATLMLFGLGLMGVAAHRRRQ